MVQRLRRTVLLLAALLVAAGVYVYQLMPTEAAITGATKNSMRFGLASGAASKELAAAIDDNTAVRTGVTSSLVEDFDQAAGTTPHGRWVLNEETANTTNDFMANEATGAYYLAFSGNDEAQANQISYGDNLMIDMDKNPIVEFRLRVDNGGINAYETIYFGVCPAHTNAEATMDNIDDSCFFMLDGSGTWTDIVVQSDDGTNDISDDSNIDLEDDTWTTFRIDFSSLAEVKMYVDGVEETGVTKNMSASAATDVQVIVVIQRSGNSGSEAVTPVEIDYIYVSQDR